MSGTLVSRIKGSPDYFAALTSGYALMGTNVLVQVLLVPLYLHSLGKYQFGILVTLLAFLNYAAIGITWMSGGIGRKLGECSAKGDHERFAQAYAVSKVTFVGYAALVAVGMAVVGWALYLGMVGNLPETARETVGLTLFAAAVYFVVQYELNVEMLAYTAMKRQGIANALQILSTLVFAVTVWIWLSKGGGLEGIPLCLLAGVVVARVVSWVMWQWIGKPAFWRWPDREAFSLITHLLGPLGGGYILYGVFLLTMQADIMIVGWLGGAEMAAEFVLVWKIAEVLTQLLWRIPEYLQPYLIHMDAAGETQELGEVYRKCRGWLLLLSGLTAAGYALAGPWLVRAWVGPSVAPDNPWAYALAGAAIFWLGIARLPAVFAYAMVKLKGLIRVAGVEVFGKLVLTVALFPMLGYVAPLVALTVVHVGGTAWAYRRLIHEALPGV